MKQKDFDKLIRMRHAACCKTLSLKKIVYTSGSDRLSNFKDTGAMNQVTPQDALWGMVSKHIIATKDMVKSGNIPSDEWIKEYLGDIHNYLYLLEGVWKEEDEVINVND